MMRCCMIRVEIILVITGLGAHTLEETLSNVSSVIRLKSGHPQVVERKLHIPTNFQSDNTELQHECEDVIQSSTSNNLDIPAFLRRNK
jgi:DICT domain-containing protein